MEFRGLLIVCATLLAGSVAAQSTAPTPTTQNDRWEMPPAASSTGYRADQVLPGTAASSESPFKFREPAKTGPAYKPPPQANDKAAIMGKQRPWQNGRPPANCALDPRDPACH